MKQVLSSDVDSDNEAVHTKARHVLKRLQSGHYDRYFKNDVYRCPFYKTRTMAGHKKPKPKIEPEITGTEPEISGNSVFGYLFGLANRMTEIIMGCSVIAS